MSRKRVTYILSNINKALAFEWIAESIDHSRFELEFILLNPGPSELGEFLKQRGSSVKEIQLRGKKDLPLAFLKVFWQFLVRRPVAVHCHLFEANLCGLTAAWLLRIPHRIYTRHHSTYHHQYFPSAIKYDKYCNALATTIVAITATVKKVLVEMEHVSENKVAIVHHGFRLSEFQNVPESEVRQLQQLYNPANKRPVIGCISRFTYWKGVQYIIEAFRDLLPSHPNALLLLANARGNYKAEIQELLNTLPKDSYKEIDFENRLFALYQLFDVFVHVPVDSHSEAFGQTYVEALAAEIPSVFTLSGIANDFIKNEENALVVPYKSSPEIKDAVVRLLNDSGLREQLKENGKKSVFAGFDLPVMINALENLYS
ncbi:MAG: glycosyltransferase family 4 protein [Chitinophagales bacterium]